MMLLDTSGLLALLLADEPQHKPAIDLYASADKRVTHNFVIAELIAGATGRGVGRERILEFVNDLENSSEVLVVYVDKELYRAGLHLLQRRLDKKWSLCDAVSFVMMTRLKITDALTHDHHFKQAGFRALLET